MSSRLSVKKTPLTAGPMLRAQADALILRLSIHHHRP